MAERLKVLIASSEIVPFAKTGGLADVAGALPKALVKFGVEVAVILPKYQMVDERKFNLLPTGKTVDVPIGNEIHSGRILSARINKDIQAFFMEKDEYYNRPFLYGTPQGDYPDNAERFIFFSRGVIEACRALNFQPDVIHCNDWQTGLVPVYLRILYKNEATFGQTVTIFTVHNMGYQGIFPPSFMPLAHLDWSLFNINGLEFYGKVNLMKGALVFSDIITTVSKTYSQEIQTPEYGFGLDGVLREHKENLFGILNGIDYQEWCPEDDVLIPYNYGRDDLSGKKKCKVSLLAEHGLPFKVDRPLIGMISRMADQKGFDLISEAFEAILALQVQVIILGSGDEKYHKIFADIGKRYPDQVIVKITYDNSLAHKIEAGSDIFLMPSRYEPCGLNQLYSLRYGTLPVVRNTGGLEDSIIDYFADTEKGTGFKFYSYSSAEMLKALTKVVSLYQNRAEWEKIQIRAMSQDFSWETSAKQYIELYSCTLSRKRTNLEKF